MVRTCHAEGRVQQLPWQPPASATAAAAAEEAQQVPCHGRALFRNFCKKIILLVPR
jgi:hypothetical protein